MERLAIELFLQSKKQLNKQDPAEHRPRNIKPMNASKTILTFKIEIMTTKIKAKKDLFNAGKCFAKGKVYQVGAKIKTAAGLMEYHTINDQGELHLIGSWWREFEIVN